MGSVTGISEISCWQRHGIDQACPSPGGLDGSSPSIRFRHTCASLLVQARVSMKQVQLWTGHRDFSTTANIYAYLTSGALVESAGGQV